MRWQGLIYLGGLLRSNRLNTQGNVCLCGIAKIEKDQKIKRKSIIFRSSVDHSHSGIYLKLLPQAYMNDDITWMAPHHQLLVWTSPGLLLRLCLCCLAIPPAWGLLTSFTSVRVYWVAIELYMAINPLYRDITCTQLTPRCWSFIHHWKWGYLNPLKMAGMLHHLVRYLVFPVPLSKLSPKLSTSD